MEENDRQNDDLWKWGIFYYNPSNAHVIVKKRYGWGWTFNFAHAMAYVYMVGLIIIIVAINRTVHYYNTGARK